MTSRSALFRIDLKDEDANYTIGQLVTHLKLPADISDYEKIEKLLRRREDKVKEEARREMMEEVVKWKVKFEESVMKFDEDVRVLRERYDELRMQKGVRVSTLFASKGNVESLKGKLRLGEVKLEVNEGNDKSDLVKENMRLRKEVMEYKEMIALLKNGVKIENKRITEMKSLEKKVETDIEVFDDQCKRLQEEKEELIKDFEAWRAMIKDLRKREDEAKARVSDLEILLKDATGLRVMAEKDHEDLKRKFQDLMDENLKLRKDVAEWRKTDKDLRKREQDVKLRVRELEREVETEESLRRRAEEALEALEHKFQELEMRISAAEKDANMLVAGAAELDCSRNRKVARRTSSIEASGSSKRVNLVDLTEGTHPGDSQAGNLTEGHVNRTGIDCARMQPAAAVVYISDSDDDDSFEYESPLIFKRKRPRKQSL